MHIYYNWKETRDEMNILPPYSDEQVFLDQIQNQTGPQINYKKTFTEIGMKERKKSNEHFKTKLKKYGLLYIFLEQEYLCLNYKYLMIHQKRSN